MTPIQSIDLAALTAAPQQVAGPQTQVTVYDVARFQEAFANAAPAQVVAPPTIQPISPGFQAVLQNFESLNGRASDIGELTAKISAGGDPTPSEMMQLTVKAHEFMFHAELTSNVANRTSDGIQQLFRQQS